MSALERPAPQQTFSNLHDLHRANGRRLLCTWSFFVCGAAAARAGVAAALVSQIADTYVRVARLAASRRRATCSRTAHARRHGKQFAVYQFDLATLRTSSPLQSVVRCRARRPGVASNRRESCAIVGHGGLRLETNKRHRCSTMLAGVALHASCVCAYDAPLSCPTSNTISSAAALPGAALLFVNPNKTCTLRSGASLCGHLASVMRKHAILWCAKRRILLCQSWVVPQRPRRVAGVDSGQHAYVSCCCLPAANLKP